MKIGIILFLFLILANGVNSASVIDLNEKSPYNPIISELNKYPKTKLVAMHYDSFAIKKDNETLVVKFENNQIKSIHEMKENEQVDFTITLSNDQMNYLYLNWNKMSFDEKIEYFFNLDMKLSDLLKLCGLLLLINN